MPNRRNVSSDISALWRLAGSRLSRRGVRTTVIEPLEPRILLSTYIVGSWVGGSGASNPNDGWFDWTENGQNGGNPGADGMTYLNTNTSGATYSFVKDGNVPGNPSGYSMDVTWPGSVALQNFALKLEYEPNWPSDVYADDEIQIQVTVPATTQSGYEQLYAIAINAPSPVGFDNSFAGNPVAAAEWGWGTGGGAAKVDTITISYSSILTQLASSGHDMSNPGWFELIFSTNSDGNHNSIYFDQVSMTGPSSTTSVLTSSLDPSVFDQSVTFTDTVSASGGTPTGTVSFMDGSTTLGTGTLNGSGVATFTTSALSLGSSSITAVYGGEGNFTGSTSPGVIQTVDSESSAASG